MNQLGNAAMTKIAAAYNRVIIGQSTRPMAESIKIAEYTYDKTMEAYKEKQKQATMKSVEQDRIPTVAEIRAMREKRNREFTDEGR